MFHFPLPTSLGLIRGRLLNLGVGLLLPIASVLPVPGPVVAKFQAPACEWCAGRRGLVFDSQPGEEVRAVVEGHVSFAGVVAGIRYVTLITGDGWKVTFGRLQSTTLTRGDHVAAGEVVGTAGDNLFLSLRFGRTPYDPARMYRRRAVLLP